MGIRLPLTQVLAYTTGLVATGPASVSGGVAVPFTVPQDTDNIVVKFSASILAGGASATLQTTDDGGTTWWDVARTSIVSNANSVYSAEWITAPVIGQQFPSSSIVATGSVSGFTTIGRAGASTLGGRSSSGLPILSQYNRIFLQYTAAVTSILSQAVTVYANSQTPFQ